MDEVYEKTSVPKGCPFTLSFKVNKLNVGWNKDAGMGFHTLAVRAGEALSTIGTYFY